MPRRDPHLREARPAAQCPLRGGHIATALTLLMVLLIISLDHHIVKVTIKLFEAPQPTLMKGLIAQQVLHVSGIEMVVLIAELAVDVDASLLGQQRHHLLAPQ